MKRPHCIFHVLLVGILWLMPAGAFSLSFNNSDFEDGPVGWIEGKTGGTIGSFSIDPDAFSGLNAAKITVESADGYCMISNDQYPRVFKPGNYIFELYLKTSGAPERVHITLFRSNSSLTFPTDAVTSQIISSFSTVFQRYQITGIALSAGDCLRLELGLANSSEEIESSVWIDALNIYKHNDALQDAIGILQTLSGIPTAIVDHDDINNDAKIGLEEAVYALQNAAELRIDLYNPVGTWNGTLSGDYGTGQIINWEMKNDQTIVGAIRYYPYAGGVTNINISASFALEMNALNFITDGTAVYSHPQLGTLTSAFTIDVFGVFSSDTEASGSYKIDFTDPYWTDESGPWGATKN